MAPSFPSTSCSSPWRRLGAGGAEFCPRRHRAAGRAGSATARHRATAFDRRERARLRHLSARPGRARDDVESRRGTHQAIHGGRDSGLHFSRFFTQEDMERAGPPSCCAWPRSAAASKKRVGGCARTARASGPTRILTAIRDETGADHRLRQGDARLYRAQTREEAVMLQLSSALLANLDMGKLLGAISASIREVIPHDTSTLALFDAATGEMRGAVPGPGRRRCLPAAMRAGPKARFRAGFSKRRAVPDGAFDRSPFLRRPVRTSRGWE